MVVVWCELRQAWAAPLLWCGIRSLHVSLHRLQLPSADSPHSLHLHSWGFQCNLGFSLTASCITLSGPPWKEFSSAAGLAGSPPGYQKMHDTVTAASAYKINAAYTTARSANSLALVSPPRTIASVASESLGSWTQENTSLGTPCKHGVLIALSSPRTGSHIPKNIDWGGTG